jgi:hypothetical protein
MNKHRAKRNFFIISSFRDVADHDYIAARASYRLGLYDQFLWSGLSAIEKYLKSIMLFHDLDTRAIEHDLLKAVKAIEAIPSVPLGLDSESKAFLGYLTEYGGDRYFTHPRGMQGNELFKLDEGVWTVRRVCEDLAWLRQRGQETLADFCYDEYIGYIAGEACKRQAHAFRLKYGGYLEDVLDTQNHLAQREALVWKNFHYGLRKKNKLRFSFKLSHSTPGHYFFPEIYPWVEQRVRLPSGVKEYFKKHKDDLQKAKRTSGKLTVVSN